MGISLSHPHLSSHSVLSDMSSRLLSNNHHPPSGIGVVLLCVWQQPNHTLLPLFLRAQHAFWLLLPHPTFSLLFSDCIFCCCKTKHLCLTWLHHTHPTLHLVAFTFHILTHCLHFSFVPTHLWHIICFTFSFPIMLHTFLPFYTFTSLTLFTPFTFSFTHRGRVSWEEQGGERSFQMEVLVCRSAVVIPLCLGCGLKHGAVETWHWKTVHNTLLY